MGFDGWVNVPSHGSDDDDGDEDDDDDDSFLLHSPN